MKVKRNVKRFAIYLPVNTVFEIMEIGPAYQKGIGLDRDYLYLMIKHFSMTSH